MNPEQWLSLKWNGGSTMSDRWLNQSKIIQKEIKKIQTQLKITIDISYNNVIIERENNSFYKINMSNKYIEMYQNMSALKKDEWLSKKQKKRKNEI